MNPFRYRGYYFDTETGLYYLNSRYYDLELGRFINIDDISVLDITNIALNGLYLYAYCLNNPVNEVDESGYLVWFFAIPIIFGAVIKGTIKGVQAYNSGERSWELWVIGLKSFGAGTGFVQVGYSWVKYLLGDDSAIGYK